MTRPEDMRHLTWTEHSVYGAVEDATCWCGEQAVYAVVGQDKEAMIPPEGDEDKGRAVGPLDVGDPRLIAELCERDFESEYGEAMRATTPGGGT